MYWLSVAPDKVQTERDPSRGFGLARSRESMKTSSLHLHLSLSVSAVYPHKLVRSVRSWYCLHSCWYISLLFWSNHVHTNADVLSDKSITHTTRGKHYKDETKGEEFKCIHLPKQFFLCSPCSYPEPRRELRHAEREHLISQNYSFILFTTVFFLTVVNNSLINRG